MNLSLLDLLPFCCLFLLSACVVTHTIRGNSGDDPLARFLKNDGRQILTFVGYSGAGYEDESAMVKIARDILDQHDPARTIVNAGVTPDGIGAVYKLAKERGFTTMGIASSLAKEYPPSEFVDHIFYIDDETWGGFLKGTNQLSPTSARMVAHSDTMVGIGGGEIARDELRSAQLAGKKVVFRPADLNHQAAIAKARKNGQPAPTNFAGEASTAFQTQGLERISPEGHR